MKKTLLMVLVGGMLMACHSDIDLKNVDTTTELEMGVAVPVGSVRAKLGDFVGDIPSMFILCCYSALKQPVQICLMISPILRCSYGK